MDQIKLVTTGGIMGAGHDVMSAVMFLREALEAAVGIARQHGLPVAVHATAAEAVKWGCARGRTRSGTATCSTRRRPRGWPSTAPTTSRRSRSPASRATRRSPRPSTRTVPSTSCPTASASAPTPLPPTTRRRSAWRSRRASGSRAAPTRGRRARPRSSRSSSSRAAVSGHTGRSSRPRAPPTRCAARPTASARSSRGKLADLIAVAADPLEDISNLRRLLLVMKDGRVVVDRRRAEAKAA